MAHPCRLNFQLEATATGSRARAARFRTLHNEVLTPLFMPVGTRATVRHQQLPKLDKIGSQILLANTYHLHLSPGPEVFKKIGGIHKFMHWNKSVLTDSGGFQIFSLSKSRNMTEEGARFKSYINGDMILLSPETSIQTQMAIGSDIMMVLDQCVPSTVDHKTAKQAMELSVRWAERSLQTRGDSPQSMFGIIQGACFEDLRKISAELTTQMNFDGFAIGGLAVGETKSEREDFTELTTQFMPANKPRYLMGVGTPLDLLEAVHRGVDMFDCIIPTALATQGVAYTSIGRIRLTRGVYKSSNEPLDPNCNCDVCKHYSRAYLHHLIKTKEPLGASLIGEHNVAHYHDLMSHLRNSILNDTFLNLYQKLKISLSGEDLENPVLKPAPKLLPKNKKELGNYIIVETPSEDFRIQQKTSGEVMHSVNDPIEEAIKLYVEQSHLISKLQEPGDDLIVWDVGLGAAYNAMTAIHEVQKAQLPQRPLKIISFENDLDSLRLALKFSTRFPHLHHAGPKTLLETKKWISKCGFIQWELFEGDFLIQLNEAPQPDIIFYDPFSAKSDSELWTTATFTKLFDFLKKPSVELFTYSASTAVRSTLLYSGFWVAKGTGSGPKTETTIAAKTLPGNTSREWLNSHWLERWKRSHTKTPLGINPKNYSDKLILDHPQFQFVPPNFA